MQPRRADCAAGRHRVWQCVSARVDMVVVVVMFLVMVGQWFWSRVVSELRLSKITQISEFLAKMLR